MALEDQSLVNDTSLINSNVGLLLKCTSVQISQVHEEHLTVVTITAFSWLSEVGFALESSTSPSCFHSFWGDTGEGREAQKGYVVSEETPDTCALGNWNLQTIHQFGTVYTQPQLQFIISFLSKKRVFRKDNYG